MSPLPPPPPLSNLSALAGYGRRTQVLLVTYDLRTPTHNYTPFFEALQQQGAWWHYISSAWLIATTETPQELYNRVVSRITTADSLLVISVKKPYWGYLPKEAWDWINLNVKD
jgi:hypothetical protein